MKHIFLISLTLLFFISGFLAKESKNDFSRINPNLLTNLYAHTIENPGKPKGAGGCSNFGSQFPVGTQTFTSSWQFVNNTQAGHYSLYSVTSGETYHWSLCPIDGGAASYDSQLTLFNETNATAGNDLVFSDDFCGDDGKIVWTATFTGTVRILISEYDCVGNVISTTLAFKKIASTPFDQGSISGDQTVCFGADPVVFISVAASGGSGGAISYDWESTVVAGCSSGWSSIGVISAAYDVPAGISATTCYRRKATDGVTSAYSNEITVTVSSTIVPSVTIVADVNPICEGSLVTFTASPVNEGTAPIYQWAINGLSAGTNSAVFASSALVNNDQVSCDMISNANCASPSIVTSNYLTTNIIGGTAPAITSTAPASFCGSGTITLSATASNGIINWYAASSGGIALATGTEFTTGSINSTTTYYVDATDNGCSSLSRTPVIATIKDIPTITGIVPGFSCGAGVVDISATASAGVVKWYMNESGGIEETSGSNFSTPLIASTTTFYVDATFDGCITASRTPVVATIYAPLLVDAGTDYSIPFGSATVFSGSAMDGSGSYSYIWSPADSLATNNVSNPQTIALTDTTIFTLLVTDLTTSCQGSAQIVINVLSPLFVVPTATPTVVCLGGSSQLAAGAVGGSGNYTYNWSIPGTLNNSTIANPLATLLGVTTYEVTVSDGYSNAINSVTITINSPIVTSISLQPTDVTTASGTNAVFSVAANGSGLTYQWQENQGSGWVNLSDIGIYSGASTGTLTISGVNLGITGYQYQCKLTNECGQPTTSNSAVLTVSSLLSACTTFDILYPSSAQNLTTSWQAVTNTWAGDYSLWNVKNGYTYEWSMCAADGGDASYDSELSLYNNTNATSGNAVGYSDNACGDDAKIHWTSSFTGVVRILITEKILGNACLSNFIDSRLAYREVSTGTPLLAGSISADQTICSGGNPAAFTSVVASGGSGPITYQWQSTTVAGCAGGWADIVGGTTATYDIPAGLTTTTCYRRNAIDAVNTVSSNEITITVTPTAVPTINIVAGANPICLGSSVSFMSTSTNGGATPIYQWMINGLNVGINSSSFSSSILVDNDLVSCNLTSNAVCAGPTVVTSNVVTIAISGGLTPSIISTTPDSVCDGGILTLGATASAGTVRWYSTATGGMAIATGTTYVTPSLSVTSSYYVDATNNGCISANRTAVAATVHTSPIANAGIGTSIPAGTSTTLLGSATGGSGNYSYNWSPSASLISSNIQNPQTVALLNQTVFSLTVTDQATTCISTTQVTINVTANPLIISPSATLATICLGSTSQLNANASGGSGNYTYVWSNAATLNNNQISNPVATPMGTTIYFVTVNDGITSLTDQVIVSIVQIPVILSTTSLSTCDSGSVVLSASTLAGSVNWYTNSSGGSSLASGTNFTTPLIFATTTYYVDATNNGCTSLTRTAVVATIVPSPSITGITSGSRCNAGTVALSVVASAGSVQWYTNLTGGTSVATGTTFNTPSIIATTTYYVDASFGGCTSSERSPVVATINSRPIITTTTPGARCSAGTVNLGAVASAGIIDWYTTLAGSSSIGTGNVFTTGNILATTTYYVDATNAACTTPSRTPVVASVFSNPSVNLGFDTIVCGNSFSLHPITNATSYVWSTGSTASTILVETEGLYSVTVTSHGICTNIDDIYVTLNTPIIVNLGADTSICDNSTVVLNAGAGAGYLWSTGESTQLINVTSTGLYTVTVAAANGCLGTDSKRVTYSKGVIKGRVTYNGTAIASQLSIHIYSLTKQTKGGFDEVSAQISYSGTGNYIITGLLSDEYIVKAVVNSHTTMLNSYYTDSSVATADWSTATVLNVACDTVVANISMGSRFNNGMAFGHVRGGVYYPSFGATASPLGTPVAGADVFLELRPDLKSVANVRTSLNGAFDFTYVKWGKYSIRVDIPGFDQFSTYNFEVRAGDTIVRNLNFIVDTIAGMGSIDTIIYLSVPNADNIASSFSIYPNPFMHSLHVETQLATASNVSLEIVNTLGVVLLKSDFASQSAGSHSFVINTENKDLKPGTYYVRLICDDNIYLKKIIKVE